MKEAKHDASRTDFQIERLVFFTDAVLAIAITILVFDLKTPVLAVFTDHALLQSLSETAFKFFGFIISFAIIGYYWAVHHRIFGYVRKYTPALFWINLGFLFSIVLFPFSSGLVGAFSTHSDMHVPYLVYTVNICFSGLMNCWIWLYVSNPSRMMLTRKLPATRIRLGVYRSLVIPVIFLLSLFVSFFAPVASRFILLLIPVALLWGMRGLERKADRHDKHLLK